MSRLSLQARILSLADELYSKDWGELEREVEELALAVKRRKRKREEMATLTLKVVKKAMVRALMEGNDKAFYRLAKIKKNIEGLAGDLHTYTL